MAPKSSQGEGILAKVIRMFQAGELDISVDSALEKVALCQKYQKPGGCNTRCKQLHVDKDGKLRPSVGLGCILLASWRGIQRLIQVFT